MDEITSTESIIDGIAATVWTLTIDGGTIGHLDAHTATGLILNVEIETGHQGEGHARRLYEHADTQIGLQHVPTWGRTPEGEIFAEAMGGDVMDDQEACDILSLDIDIVTGAAFAA